MEYRVAIWSFLIFNTKNALKYQNFYLETQMEHDQSSYFCRGPDDFCWGPAPVDPTLVNSRRCFSQTGLTATAARSLALIHLCRARWVSDNKRALISDDVTT